MNATKYLKKVEQDGSDFMKRVKYKVRKRIEIPAKIVEKAVEKAGFYYIFNTDEHAKVISLAYDITGENIGARFVLSDINCRFQPSSETWQDDNYEEGVFFIDFR